MSSSLADAVVWITGGGSGIGRALALEVARQGAHVALSGRRADRLQEVVDTITDRGGDARPFPCDVTDEDGLVASVHDVVEHFGRLDVAVANAGYGVAAPFESISATQWRRQLDVNVVGLANTFRAALPALRKTKGRLVGVASIMGRVALAGSSPYVASKFAVIGLCETVRLELHGTGVSVTTILPGLVESEISRVDNNGEHRPEWEDRRPKMVMWPAERAAKVMTKAIANRKRELVFTGHGRALTALGRHVPSLLYWSMARFSGRSS